MAFDSLSEKLQNVFKNLRSKGRLTEADVKTALKEVKMALLEADVNFKVVKQFVKDVEERAVGQDVMNGLNPGQMVIKIVNEEMVRLMGSETAEITLQPGKAVTVIMMTGLQGAGKTTTAAKLAGKFKQKGKKVLLVAGDVYRPAAIEQLQINGQKQGVEVFSMGDKNSPVNIAKAAMEHAAKNDFNIVIIDTAGRLHIDEDMMAELIQIKENVTVHQTVLVVDAMTGQDAVNVAKTFDERIGIDGVILTKLDGDTRGGAALSIRAVTGKPIFYAGMGEKLSDLEQFYPDRMASRILGMGDVLTLIEKAQEDFDEERAKKIEQKMRKNEFDFEMYLESMSQMKKMGGLSSILGMMPGLGMGAGKMPDIDEAAAEKSLSRTEAIIYSMTPEERQNPSLLNPSRKRRIAVGAGVDIAEVNRLVKQFEQMKKMMKQNLELSGNQIHDTHRRFLECQKVIIQIERPALVVFRDRIDHLKNAVRRLLCRNRFHIRSLNDTFVHGITDQLFQFPVDIAHIRSRLTQKKLHHRSRNILSLFFQARQHPARNQFFRLGGEFHYFSGVLHCLVHPGTLVHFLLHKHEIGACSGLCQILRQFIAGIFEKTAVLDKNDSALRKKRKGLRKINNLLRVDVLSLEAVKIHIAVSARQHAAHPGILSRRSERIL